MKNTTITEGEWIATEFVVKTSEFEIHKDNLFACFVESKTAGVKPALAFGFTKEEALANAKIMAASKNLLAALIEANILINNLTKNMSPVLGKSIKNTIIKAIDKATK